jgi:hypothetical protein
VIEAFDDRRAHAPRPKTLDPREIGFTPRKPVPWLGPILLAGTGARVFFAQQFGAYLDKRELQNAFPVQVYDHSRDGELWLDFVADLGDGFDPTYTIAYLLAQRELTVGTDVLPRSQVVVMGGDQVYPTASGGAYDDRFKGPYRAAMPAAAPGERTPTIYALPGNHDWYDGLTAFFRIFARQGGAHIGGWRTAQSRSYFALQLPHRWWLLGIDAQPGAYLDDPQLGYFRQVATHIQPGDQVIICTPIPGWVESVEVSTLYDTTDYFMRKIVTPTGAHVALMLSGDLHHYARYANAHRELITSGGGGAYLYATHELPKKLIVPPQESIVRESSPPERYALKSTYPSRMRSRALGSGVFARLPMRNPGFLGLLGVLQTLLLLALGNAKHDIITIPVFLMVTATFALTIFLSAALSSGATKARHYVLGFTHGAVQVGLAVGGLFVWQMLPFDDQRWPLPVLFATVIYGPVAAVVSGEVVAAYLLIASKFGVNLNELFASQGIRDFKNFLRLHFAADGSLTIYPIGIDSVGKRWRAAPDGPPHAAWIEPKRPLRPTLIEAPIRLPGAANQRDS